MLLCSGIMVSERQNQAQKRSTEQMLPRNHPDRIQIAFDDLRLVSNAGLLVGPLHSHRRTLRAQVLGCHVKPGLLGVGAHLCQSHDHRRGYRPGDAPLRHIGVFRTRFPHRCRPATRPGRGGEPAELVDDNSANLVDAGQQGKGAVCADRCRSRRPTPNIGLLSYRRAKTVRAS